MKLHNCREKGEERTRCTYPSARYARSSEENTCTILITAVVSSCPVASGNALAKDREHQAASSRRACLLQQRHGVHRVCPLFILPQPAHVME